MNTKLTKILNGGTLTLKLLTQDHWNRTLNREHCNSGTLNGGFNEIYNVSDGFIVLSTAYF
jgi:hypothetical protein